MTAIPDSRNSSTTIPNRREYIERILFDRIDLYNNTIYIDEAGFNYHLIHSRGRSLHGQPAVKRVINNRGKNLSIITAMNGHGILKFTPHLGSVNKAIFKRFLIQLKRLLPVNQKRYIILDNVKFHHSPEVTNVLRGTLHEIIYLPPYSLFLNPVEKVFSKVKNQVAKHRLENHESIIGRIEEAFDMITENDCINWITHTRSYFDHCLNEEEIEM
ncbi:7116_t:CDS:1 [Racocetra fulgida]|uniref:7116_t:CDS:1 n=1 Tax=Racocetra fulgida TaxID=60492 RepID=A0A9N9B461_9GLOM|nr:7116_t:CDS:1 [Racocetra fulgida]